MAETITIAFRNKKLISVISIWLNKGTNIVDIIADIYRHEFLLTLLEKFKIAFIFPILLNGNEKKRRKREKTVFESPEKEMLAHRVQTKYSLGHLICIAILCAYICGLGLKVSKFQKHFS